MEMAMNMGAFEALNDDELMLVDGGSTKVAAGVCTICAGVCFIVSGVASLFGNSEVAAGAGILGGIFGAAAGVCALFPAP